MLGTEFPAASSTFWCWELSIPTYKALDGAEYRVAEGIEYFLEQDTG